MKPLRYGMLGGGPGAYIGIMHRKAIALDGTAVLCAACFSENPEKNAQMGAELNMDEDRLYQNYHEMIEQEKVRPDRIDFVVIATPNHTHYDMCKCFLENGFHVACDKPLTLEIEEALALEALAERKKLVLCVTYTYTGHASLKSAKEVIARGDIGEIRMVMAEYPLGWLAQQGAGGKQAAWRQNPQYAGISNCMSDIGTHIENAVHYITGLHIRRLLSKLDHVVEGRALDDNGVVMLEYDNGASGVYWASQVAVGCENAFKIRVFGSKGSIAWEQENPEYLAVADEYNTLTIYRRAQKAMPVSHEIYTRTPAGHPEGYIEALANIYRNMALAISAGNRNGYDYPRAKDGVAGVKFVHKVVESNRCGNVWVDM